MTRQRIKYLHDRYLSDSLSVEEEKEWRSIFGDSEAEQKLLEALYENWDSMTPADRISMRDQRSAEIYQRIEVATQPVVRKMIWPRIGIAAAVALMICCAGLFFYKKHIKQRNETITYKNEVGPGKSGATLTLANGRKIRLTNVTNGELAREAGVVVSKAADGQLVYEIKESKQENNKINTLSTDKGETYRLRLPDGSIVCLNSASRITYTAGLVENGKRKVELEGEGYFEVAKDKVHPFIVQTGDQQVEVLGTHFNVNAYQDEPAITTTLLEGMVRVSAEAVQQTIKPGQQVINTKNRLSVVKADTEMVTDWVSGDFNLADVDFQTAMRKIARWYDVEIVYDQNIQGNIQLGGWISRNKPLSGVLQFIEKSGMVHFKVDGRKVYVMK